MRAVIYGASGYVGSAVARAFKARGYTVSGIGREGSAEAIAATGLIPVEIEYSRPDEVMGAIADNDVIVFAAMMAWPDEQALMHEMLAALAGSDRTFLYTSGTGVLSMPTTSGEWSDYTFAEDEQFPFQPTPDSLIRLETERMVRESAQRGIRSFVIRPGLIWGHGGSIQIPRIFDSAFQTGSACYMGKGLNLYTNVHVDDLAEAYALAHERGTPGALYQTASGEANFRSIAEAVAEALGCEARSVSYEEACGIWGKGWVDLAIAVNSRSRSPRSRTELGWAPKHLDVIEDIRSGSYREKLLAKTGWAAEGFTYSGAHGAD